MPWMPRNEPIGVQTDEARVFRTYRRHPPFFFSLHLEGAAAAEAGPIQSLTSGKCVDLERGTTTDGPVVIQFDCHSGPNQKWSFVQAGGGGYRIVSQLSKKCIGIDRTSAASSGAIIQSSCGAGASEQLWSLVSGGGGYFIKTIESGLCLDVPGGSAVSGAKLVAWKCTGRENQVWRLAF